MPRRKLIYSFLGILLIVSFILAGIIFHSQNRELKVAIFDVGQGDAILIEQGNNQILIDGGPSGQKVLEKMGLYMPFWDRKIEIIIATHPDQDHIAGLIEVMKNYEIGKIMDNGMSAESQVYKRFKEIIRQKNISEMEGKREMNIKLSGGAELKILWPREGENLKDSNGASIVTRLAYGESSFLFTGDLPSDQEMVLASQESNLNSQVLKVAHHGSRYSTGAEFLDKINPEKAVISVGKNSYGHPSQEVLDRLDKKGIKILRTDKIGDIVYNCENNGNRCELNID